jgi:hypothetical protein
MQGISERIYEKNSPLKLYMHFPVLEMAYYHGNTIIKECVFYLNLSVATTNLRMN